MDMLLKTLYEYAYRHRMLFYLEDETQFHECEIMSERNRKELRRLLSEEGRAYLENYDGEQRLQRSLELEAMFRAGLSLGLELSRL